MPEDRQGKDKTYTQPLLSPLITGALLDRTGTLDSGLLLAGGMLGIAGFLVLLIPQRRS